MIYEWRPNVDTHNFGDYLGKLLIPGDIRNDFDNREDLLLLPIGSVINNAVMEHAEWLGKKAVFLNCGWDGSFLKPELVRKSTFIGCRGPLTQRELARYDVRVSITGDPGYGVSDFQSQNFPKTGVLLVPHGTDEISFESTPPDGVSEILSPFVKDELELFELVRKISNAEFVLAGAMHAAITAHALNVPFGLYKSPTEGFVDHPLKWRDWLASVKCDNPLFHSDLESARKWHEMNISKKFLFGRGRRKKYLRFYSQKNLRKQLISINDMLT